LIGTEKPEYKAVSPPLRLFLPVDSRLRPFPVIEVPPHPDVNIRAVFEDHQFAVFSLVAAKWFKYYLMN
jgi:hypothetical protein